MSGRFGRTGVSFSGNPVSGWVGRPSVTAGTRYASAMTRRRCNCRPPSMQIPTQSNTETPSRTTFQPSCPWDREPSQGSALVSVKTAANAESKAVRLGENEVATSGASGQIWSRSVASAVRMGAHPSQQDEIVTQPRVTSAAALLFGRPGRASARS